MTPEQAWQATLAQLQMEMPKHTFETWVREAHFLAFEAGTVTIGGTNAYTCAWLEARLASTVVRILSGILGQEVGVRFVIASQQEKESPATPEQAWQHVLAQLRPPPEAQEARFWQEMQFLAYYGQTFIVGLPTHEARAWVEKTVNGRVSERLAGLMHQPVKVQFVVAPQEESRPFENPSHGEQREEEPHTAEASPPAGGEGRRLSDTAAEILIKPRRASLRETIIRSHQVVLVSAYLLRWLPYLGPDQGWFLLAMRQAFFQAYGKKLSSAQCGQTFTVNRSRLARWAGMGEGLVRQYLEGLDAPHAPGNFLTWFMQSFTHGRGTPKGYTFRADMPLTPGDAEQLHQWLLENGIRESPLETLQNALAQQPRALLPFPPPPPAPHHRLIKPDPRTIQEVVLAASGMAKTHPEYIPLKKLADELQTHLQSPADNLLFTHYFLLEWLPKLGRTPAWVIAILRDRGFIDHTTGIRRDRIKLEGGYRELAQLLSVSERQIRDWLPALESMAHRSQSLERETLETHWEKRQVKRSLVSYFLEKFGIIDRSGSQETTYEFRVKLEEPLTPEHQEIYEGLEQGLYTTAVTGAVTDLAWLVEELDVSVREPSNAEDPRSANAPTSSPFGPQMIQPPPVSVREDANPRSANDPGWGAVAPRTIHLKALLTKHLYPKALLEIKQLLQQHLSELSQTETDQPEIGEEGGLIWDWEKLLGYGGFSKATRQEIFKNPQLQAQFLGQVLYGFAHKATGEEKGIKTPFKFAEKHCHERPLPEYMELANLPPAELKAVLNDWGRTGPAYALSEAAYQVTRALRIHEFLRVLEDATISSPPPPGP